MGLWSTYKRLTVLQEWMELRKSWKSLTLKADERPLTPKLVENRQDKASERVRKGWLLQGCSPRAWWDTRALWGSALSFGQDATTGFPKAQGHRRFLSKSSLLKRFLFAIALCYRIPQGIPTAKKSPTYAGMMLKINGTFSSLHKPSLAEGSWFPIDKTKVLPFQITLPHHSPSPPCKSGDNHRLLLPPVLRKKSYFI